jgi:septum formation protein
MALTTEELVLASASPTRAQLLRNAGLNFRVESAAVDEEVIKHAFRIEHRAAVDCALALGEAKALPVAAASRNRALVIGADQILVCDSQWFDKPLNFGAARAQLQALRNRTHELVTAVCVVQEGTTIWHTVSRPRLTMRGLSDNFIDDYLRLEGAAILGSVGAYRLETRGVQLFERIEGDYFAILGLPLVELLGFLRSVDKVPT